MSTEFWVVVSLVVLSAIGAFWPKIVSLLSFPGIVDTHNPDKFQRRMDLVNELLEECKGCDAEIKAVIAAGDVIAKHWRELPDGTHAKGTTK